MTKITVPENLDERFTAPKNFRFHSFTREGRKIRFGSVFPKDSIPDAIVVCLPGLSEPIEKYFEVARDLLDKNLAVWVIDWMGQGASGRYLPNAHKRHSSGFSEDVKDLHYLAMEYVKHASVHPDRGRIPMAMLGHSLGGNIGMRYLAEHPDVFECAAFSAPLFGIHKISDLPNGLIMTAAKILNSVAGNKYARNQDNWSPATRDHKPGEGAFSSDPTRDSIHMKWLEKNPDLQIGGVTYKWVYRSLVSCKKIKKLAPQINKPILMGVADDDTIVHNGEIEKVAGLLPNAKTIKLPHSKHEILMEKDDIRTAFLDAFYKLICENIIEKPETLKPF